MSKNKLFLAGTAVLGGFAGYALARNRDEAEKMGEAALEMINDVNGSEDDNTKDKEETANKIANPQKKKKLF